MKFSRILCSMILLIALIGCSKDELVQQEPQKPKPDVDKIEEWLKTLPGVESVNELEAGKYKKHFLILFRQPLDPQNPSAGTFLQRVFLSHQDFNSPVVFETEGYNAESSMTKTFQTELTRRYNANRVVVEHRYSGESVPSPIDWKYLTCENAAADLHAVRVALAANYTSPWIATGASKGGTNAMSYIMYYPNDMTAAVAYVGPICNSKQDARFVKHMQTVATPEMRKKIVDFQRQLLSRRTDIQPLFYPTPTKPTLAKEYMSNDQTYEWVIVNFPHRVWQLGWPIESIPSADATNEKIINYLVENKVFGTRKPKDFVDNKFNKYNEEDEYNEEDDFMLFFNNDLQDTQDQSDKAYKRKRTYNAHYCVQTLIELGYYAYTIEPIEDLMPNHKEWSTNTMARFYVPADAADIQFSDKLYNQMTQWLQSSDPRLICVYGEYDPWSAAAPDKASFAGKTNMEIFIQKAGSHSAKIHKLSAADKQQAWSKLDSWIK